MMTAARAGLAIVALALTLAPLGPGAQAQPSYETPPVVKASDLAPAGLLVGQERIGWRVHEGSPTAAGN